MSELKTLKDLENNADWDDVQQFIWDVRAEAIKWVKEDIKDVHIGFLMASGVIKRWMKRLNITEEDLK